MTVDLVDSTCKNPIFPLSNCYQSAISSSFNTEQNIFQVFPPDAPVSELSATSSTQVLQLKIAPRKWDPNSAEAKKRERALINHFVSSGLPTRVVDEESFKELCSALDPKFSIPG